MRIQLSRFASNAVAFFVASAILVGCSGSQLAPLGLERSSGVAPFDMGKIQSTAVASVAHDAQRVSPNGIVYTPANVQIENAQYNLDLDNDGTSDFVITESNTTTPGRCNPERGQDVHARLSLAGQGSNGSEVRVNGYVARITSGSPIGPSQGFATGSWLMESFSVIWQQFGSQCVDSKKAAGNWPVGKHGYLGLAFVIGGETHYGWAAIEVNGVYGYLSSTLTGYAYQTTPGKSIKAGQM